MKHSIYFRDVSTFYLSHFQSVNKTTLNNAKLNRTAQMPNAIKMKWRSCLQFHELLLKEYMNLFQDLITIRQLNFEPSIYTKQKRRKRNVKS